MTHDVPGSPSGSPSVTSWHGWSTLAITAVLSAILVVVILWRRDSACPNPPAPEQSPPARARVLPRPPDIVDPRMYNVVADEFDGRQVMRISATEHGDELIVDSATGRLIAVIEPNGKTTLWPAFRNNAPNVPVK